MTSDSPFLLGLYLPVAALAVCCFAVFFLKLGVPIIRGQEPVAGNCLAVAVICFTFVLGYETPLYWAARNIPDWAWMTTVPAVFMLPKIIALAGVVFAAGGISRALTGRAHLLAFTAGAAVLWAVGYSISLIARMLP